MTVSIVELVSEAIENRLLDVFTSAIGSVRSYDAALQVAQVDLTTKRPINDELGDLQFQDLPVLQDVPVLFQRAGSYSITFPISPGDTVLVVFTTLDPSKWRDTGVVPSLPTNTKVHSLSYAFALPLVAPRNAILTAATEQAMVIAGDEIRLGAATSVEVDAVALASNVQSEHQTLFDAISNAATGTNDGGELFKQNIIQALTLAGYPNDVGSPNVKAKK